MDACKVCAQLFDVSERTVLCSGPCNKLFHPNCAGLNVTNFKAWTANVGLLWFCDACRLNFNPIINDRETIILTMMRDILTRMDSIDLRIGQYGENLKILNSLMTVNQHTNRDSGLSTRIRQHLASGSPLQRSADFRNSIDRMNFDSSLLSNPANNTFDDDVHGCTATATSDHVTTFTSSLSTINTASPPAETVASSINDGTVTLTTVTSRKPDYATVVANSATTVYAPATANSADTVYATVAANSTANATEHASVNQTAPVMTTRVMPPAGSDASGSNIGRLRVVNKRQNPQPPRTSNNEVLKSFYITPFHNEQTEDDIIHYLHDTINADADRIKCAKLVPKGKNINELSFVSFKVSVPTELVSLVSDAFYWPDGVEIREFLPKNDKTPLNVQHIITTQ